MSRLSSMSNDDGIILCGYQKKLKTMKKKYFVLYKDTVCNTARLEYYDNERKFKSGHGPKRVIKIKHCFNINRRLDTKHNYVIVLSSKDGGFGIVCESESDMLKWLEALLTLQRSNDFNMTFQPNFDHVWQVIVQKKGLAEQNGIIGNYHICLNRKSVTFIRIGLEKSSAGETRMSTIEFLLTTIRRCGDSQCFFYMEVGRQSIIGPGELWMETDDTLVAQNMHKLILSAMSVKRDIIVEPMRKRSSSANEASKPVNMLPKRQTQEENNANSPMTNKYYGRERCDSLPSRNRTTSECSNHSFSTLPLRSSTSSNLRPHMFQHDNNSPVNSRMVCSESEESSISYDELDDNGSFHLYKFNKRSDGVIPEENQDDLLNHDGKYCDSIQNTDDITSASTETYLSMTPGNTSQNYNRKYQVEIPENAADQFSYDYKNEIDNHCELPIRAYSIGSRDEHNQTAKRIGSSLPDADQSTRVRAFSVGSRAKIPRCDLQRGVLFPRTKAQHTFNSNNNISTTDMVVNNHSSHTSSCCEKKSNSAPILIHKSLNSVNIMSDLMELDFSKSNNTANKLLQHVEKNSFNKIISNVPAKDHVRSVKKMSSCEIAPTTNTPSQNGYLEMKPVCATAAYRSISDGRERNPNMSSTDLSDLKKSQDFHNKLLISKPQMNKIIDTDGINRNEENNILKKNTNTKSQLQPTETKDSNFQIVNSSLSSLKDNKINNISFKLTGLSLNNSDMDEYINVENSSVYTPDTSSAYIINKETVVTNQEAVESTSEMKSTTLKQENHSNQPQLNSGSSTDSTTKSVQSPSNQKQNIAANIINLNLTSRPQSQLLCPDNELHYASLDLPQNNSSEVATTIPKIIDIYERTAPNTTNTYAKIDFEHSDSTSLKNLNI